MGSERFFRTSMWFYNFKDVKNSNEQFKDPSHRKKTQVSYVPSKDSVIKNPPAKQETWVQSLHQEDLLEKETATHSSIPVWRIPWTEKPGEAKSQSQLKDFFCFKYRLRSLRNYMFRSSSWRLLSSASYLAWLNFSMFGITKVEGVFKGEAQKSAGRQEISFLLTQNKALGGL